MNVQVFKPILYAPNDNLLTNSGWWYGLGGYQITGGTLDTEHKFNNCNSIRQTSQDTDITIKLNGITPSPTKTLFYSCKIKLDTPNTRVRTGTTSIIYFDNGYSEAMGSSEMIEIEGDEYLYTFDLSYIDKKVISVDLIFSLGGNDCLGNIYQPKLEYGTIATPYCPSIYDDVKWDYDQYSASFQSAKVGDIQDITEYQYKKSLTDVGLFSITIPLDTPFADEIDEDYYLRVDKRDWLIVQDVKKSDTGYSIIGTDLKGLLALRETVGESTSNAMEFDSITGSTEECCKHYVLNNIINPINTKKIIPLVTLAFNQNRGIAVDTYTTRLEPLDQVIKKLCENAKIGYTMNADIMNNKIIFDVIEIVDKTIEQQIRNRVIFSKENKNISSYEAVRGNSTYKNVFYATREANSTATTQYVTEQYSTSTEPSGIARKEQVLSVSCNTDSDISKYAIFGMLNYYKINSLEVKTSDVKNYGVLYDLGDKVTIIIDGQYMNVVIDSVEINYTKENSEVILGFGEAKPKPLERLNIKIKNKGV